MCNNCLNLFVVTSNIKIILARREREHEPITAGRTGGAGLAFQRREVAIRHRYLPVGVIRVEDFHGADHLLREGGLDQAASMLRGGIRGSNPFCRGHGRRPERTVFPGLHVGDGGTPGLGEGDF